jgi:hypothetical protein
MTVVLHCESTASYLRHLIASPRLLLLTPTLATIPRPNYAADNFASAPGAHPEFLAGGANLEAIYNLCLILKLML